MMLKTSLSLGTAPGILGPWDTISSVKANDLHNVVKYRSPDTGMELVHSHVAGPNVHAYCIIAHKCDDNCGIPQVLRHMIWHGSKRYPHPGLLQRIASKCFSTCPEIVTERDHSCYKFTTVGSQGFSMFLPVFFDHILNPMLPEPVFIKEVYHVESNGRDGGTCFNTMKIEENDPEELSSLSLFETIFGEKSGYSMPYKGRSSDFRSECNLEKVRQFHDRYYHTSNCCLVVVGDIEKEELFRALSPVLHNALRSHRVKPIWQKPWINGEPSANLSDSVTRQIEFPYSFIERPVLFAHAHVKIGFVGTPGSNKINHITAIKLVLEYLMSGPIPIALTALVPNQSLFEKLDGIISTAPSVSYTEHNLKQTVFAITFTNVPSELVSSIPQMLRKTLFNEVKKASFKIRKMIKIIMGHYQNDLSAMENSLEEKILKAAVTDFLYSSHESDGTLDQKLNSAYEFHQFMSQNTEFWKDIIQTYLLNSHWVTVIAVPSQSLHEKIQAEMKERIEWRLSSENSKYMKKWALRLKAASKVSTSGPPVEYLNKYPLPSSDSIGLMKILRQDNPMWANDTLCNLYVDDINSNYAYLTIIMDTSELTIDQKKYLVLFADGILHAPYMDNLEKFHTVKECEKEIKRDVLLFETFFGLEWLGDSKDRTKFSCGTFPHLFCLRIQTEVTKVKEGFYWAQMLLWNTKWQGEKLKEIALKLSKIAEEVQSCGSSITRAILTDFLYHMDSVPKCISPIRQKIFLRQISDELPKSIRRVSRILESIRNCLLRPDNVTVHLAASLPKMEFHLTENPDARFAISELFRTTFNYTGWTWEQETKRLSNSPDRYWMKSKEYLRKCCSEQIFAMPKTNLGYLLQTGPGVTSYSDIDYPILLTAIEYFIQKPDGPLCKEIIQSGLADYMDIRVNPLEGLVYFELKGCPDLSTAYSRTFDVMARYLFDTRNGEGDVLVGETSHYWENFLLQSAKSSMIFKLTEPENTPMKMGLCSLTSYFRGLPMSSSRSIMDAITKVSMKQVQTVARRYFYPLFLQPSTCAATVPNDRVFTVIDTLMQRCGKKLSLAPPLDQSSLASFS